MSKYFTLLTPILALATVNLAACMNTSSMINDVPTTPTLKDGQGKEPYSYNKHFVKGSIKYKNYEELDGKGRTLPSDAIGVVGRFYELLIQWREAQNTPFFKLDIFGE